MVVERLRQRLLVDALLDGDLAQRPARRRGLLPDLRGAVVADVRVERRGCRQRQLGVLLEPLAVGLDAVDALLGEEARRAREELDRFEQIAREQGVDEETLDKALDLRKIAAGSAAK